MLKVLLASLLLAAAPMPPMEQIHEIVIQNRILTTVNGKTISLLDVVKQMDVFLNQHYPQYAGSKIARLQFYQMQWKQTLQQLAYNELMMADAESREVKVSDGEIREEVQNRFGPTVMTKLDELGISYEEAREIVHQDMIVQRMQWIRATSKAFQKITSQVLKDGYQQYLKENPPKEEWKYQFVTLRSPTSTTGLSDAKKIASFKEKAGASLTVAADLLKAELPPDSTTTVSVSQEFVQENSALAAAYRDVLSKLQSEQWSEPIEQVSRDGTPVIRIFHLKEHVKNEAPTFEAIAHELKQTLLNKYADQEMKTYLAKLSQRFNFDESSLDIPSDFEPFSAQ